MIRYLVVSLRGHITRRHCGVRWHTVRSHFIRMGAGWIEAGVRASRATGTTRASGAVIECIRGSMVALGTSRSMGRALMRGSL